MRNRASPGNLGSDGKPSLPREGAVMIASTILQDAETAVRSVLEDTTLSPFQLDRRITRGLESAITSISGALILLSAAALSFDRDPPRTIEEDGPGP